RVWVASLGVRDSDHLLHIGRHAEQLRHVVGVGSLGAVFESRPVGVVVERACGRDACLLLLLLVVLDVLGRAAAEGWALGLVVIIGGGGGGRVGLGVRSSGWSLVAAPLHSRAVRIVAGSVLALVLGCVSSACGR